MVHVIYRTIAVVSLVGYFILATRRGTNRSAASRATALNIEGDGVTLKFAEGVWFAIFTTDLTPEGSLAVGLTGVGTTQASAIADLRRRAAYKVEDGSL